MADLIVQREVLHSGFMILLPGEFVCSTYVRDLFYQFAIKPGLLMPGENPVSWDRPNTKSLKIIISGQSLTSGTFQFSLNNVGTVASRDIDLAVVLQTIGEGVPAHLLAYNFTYPAPLP